MRKTCGKYILFVSLLLLLSCTKKHDPANDSTSAAGKTLGNEKNGTLFSIDLSKNYPERKMVLQDIASVDYIPLETKADVFIDGTCDVGIYDSIIIVSNMLHGDFMVFNKVGKLLTHFNHRGGSGEEYLSSYGFFYDEKAQELFVLDDFRLNRMLVYSTHGQFKRKLSIPKGKKLGNIIDINEKLFLARLIDYKSINHNSDGFDYLLMSKKDARIISTLPLNFSKRIPTVFSMVVDGKRNEYIIFGFKNMMKNTQTGLIADMSSDTVYLIGKDAKLRPFLVRTPSVLGGSPAILLNAIKLTDRYFFFSKEVYDYAGTSGRSSIDLAFDMDKRELFEPVLENTDFPSYTPFAYICNYAKKDIFSGKNQITMVIEAQSLYEAYREEELSGSLKEIASTLKEDDNPVLMVVTFKF